MILSTCNRVEVLTASDSDNVDIADSTAMLLEAFGHDVRTAHTGPAALDVAGAFLPDLILMDIGLPGGSRRSCWKDTEPR